MRYFRGPDTPPTAGGWRWVKDESLPVTCELIDGRWVPIGEERKMDEPPFGQAVRAWVKSPPGPPASKKFILVRCHSRLSIWVDGDGVQYGWDELVDPEPYEPRRPS